MFKITNPKFYLNFTKQNFFVSNLIKRKASKYFTFEQAKEKLFSLQSKTMRKEEILSGHNSLKEMEYFIKALKIPLKKLPVIHVAGTKGKGSTCAFVESILRNCGLKTGLFTSPHLIDVTERIMINGKNISKENFADLFEFLYFKIAENLNQEYNQFPSFFRFLSLMAFHYFAQENVDAAIIEVGIGGKSDCTNVVHPKICGISTLGFDHMSLLGNTLQEISKQKAGIFKFGVSAITSPQKPVALQTLISTSKEVFAPLSLAPSLSFYSFSNHIHLGLFGEHQKINASLAVALSKQFLIENYGVIDDLISDEVHQNHVLTNFSFERNLENSNQPKNKSRNFINYLNRVYKFAQNQNQNPNSFEYLDQNLNSNQNLNENENENFINYLDQIYKFSQNQNQIQIQNQLKIKKHSENFIQFLNQDENFTKFLNQVDKFAQIQIQKQDEEDKKKNKNENENENENEILIENSTLYQISNQIKNEIKFLSQIWPYFLKGLSSTFWPGRCQIYQPKNKENQLYFLDGAHTPESIEIAMDWFRNQTFKMNSKPINILLFSFTGDRNKEDLMKNLVDFQFDHVFFSPLKEYKKVSVFTSDMYHSMANSWDKLNGKGKVHIPNSFSDLLKEIDQIGSNSFPQKIHIFVTGSLHLIGDILSEFETN
ncbi:folylpolyglutamate synthase [Anaeramoeba ignava]|uniref:tetrahydrofolate synthase n=1 Tax=Anaeramoeba ignava TaxID=1746090 RepID=A0A9Q0L882_ANAIG|nr:folylpolyglutamate synthase [Anaeramoeba ignava]